MRVGARWIDDVGSWLVLSTNGVQACFRKPVLKTPALPHSGAHPPHPQPQTQPRHPPAGINLPLPLLPLYFDPSVRRHDAGDGGGVGEPGLAQLAAVAAGVVWLVLDRGV